MRESQPRWIVSPAFDRLWIVGPGILPLVVLAAFPEVRAAGAEVPAWAWVACILCVDVAHVWSTIYRTYLDPAELARRPELYAGVPFACLAVGILLHSIGPIWFWRVLAYTAVFHFIRQQWGLVALYGARGGWRSPIDAKLDKLAIWAFTGYPLLWWHTHQPRPFQWFVPDDFVSLPAWPTLPVGAAIWALAILLVMLRLTFLTWTFGLRATLGGGRALILLTTALNWYLGIVAFEADFAFTVTNVLAHGIPYIALVWHYNHRKHREPRPAAPWLSRLAAIRAIPLFLVSLVLLAFVEEALWDHLVWHDHAALFGDMGLGGWAATSAVFTFLVPLLALPQFTHYVLDGFIWRLDGTNPDLREHLFAPDDRRA